MRRTTRPLVRPNATRGKRPRRRRKPKPARQRRGGECRLQRLRPRAGVPPAAYRLRPAACNRRASKLDGEKWPPPGSFQIWYDASTSRQIWLPICGNSAISMIPDVSCSARVSFIDLVGASGRLKRVVGRTLAVLPPLSSSGRAFLRPCMTAVLNAAG